MPDRGYDKATGLDAKIRVIENEISGFMQEEIKLVTHVGELESKLEQATLSGKDNLSVIENEFKAFKEKAGTEI